MLLVILQNAYRPSGKTIPRDEWLERMWASHTGRRLREMLPSGIECDVINASPLIGNESSSVFPADVAHLEREISSRLPDTILACGKVAQAGMDELGYDYVPAPHPAWRQLSKKHTAEICELIGEYYA